MVEDVVVLRQSCEFKLDQVCAGFGLLQLRDYQIVLPWLIRLLLLVVIQGKFVDDQVLMLMIDVDGLQFFVDGLDIL